MPYLLSMRATVVPGFVIDFGLSYAAKFFSITLPFQNNLQDSNVRLRLDVTWFLRQRKITNAEHFNFLLFAGIFAWNLIWDRL